jgi:hypothetical protein
MDEPNFEEEIDMISNRNILDEEEHNIEISNCFGEKTSRPMGHQLRRGKI